MSVTGESLLDVIRGTWSGVTQNLKISDCMKNCKDSKKECLCKGVEQADLSTKSRIWVCALARQFKNLYRGQEYRVFWKDNEHNKCNFSLNELLFDVSVCSVDKTESFQRKSKDLEYISQCHWQIESEFDYQNSRSVIIDMSKLVMGSSRNKLMIASHRNSDEGRGGKGVCNKDILKQCAPIACGCTGNVYFCFVAHPEKWDGLQNSGSPPDPSLHFWTGKGWEHMNAQASRT